ncbi:reverse transcriptase domain-containing protein [Tanacetum coccineum]
MPRDCLRIIESKSKVRNSRNKPVVAKVSTSNSTPGISPDVAELKDMVKALLLDKKNQSQAPATVKAVEESCVTCGGAHSHRNCPATDGNVYRDNIQEYVSQAAVANFNQGNTSYRPPIANQIRPPGFPPVQQNQGNNQNRYNQNRGNNYNQGPIYQPPVNQAPIYRPPINQPPAYQAPAPQTQGVSKEDFQNYIKANDAVMRNMQNQTQNMQNQMTNLTDLLTKFMNTNTASTSGSVPPSPSSLPKVWTWNSEGLQMDTVPPNNNGKYRRTFQLTVVQVETHVPIFEPVVAPVSASKPNPKPSIPYPSRPNDQNICEKANNQIEKFYQIFQDLHFDISFADALILMPKFSSTLKSLISNKEKLFELANTPLNEHCSALSLLELTPTCMTLELADRSISRPISIFEDVYLKVGKFRFPADFVVVDFDADPRVPLILERSFLNTGCALIDVYEGELTLRVGKESDLPPHLEYAFLEGDDKLPVIIAKDLSVEDKRLSLIKVVPTSKLGESENPTVSSKREVEKFLTSIFYPISDSPWVSPVHYVPKKGGFNVVENDENELIPTRLVTRWRVCIDYRKLNDATGKDHFSLPFMDQMLERLARNEYYCFLDGFSGYFQIPIDPHDQEKTTFTCPYGTCAYRPMPFGLCNAPGMFQRCMLAIFHDMIEKTMEAFETLKKKLTEAPILIVLDWDLPFELMCDASDFAIGAVLGQHHEKHFRPIHYASKTINEAESHYTTTEKEMLGVVYAFEKFRSVRSKELKSNKVVSVTRS